VQQGQDSVAEVGGTVSRLVDGAVRVAGTVDGITVTTHRQAEALSRIDETVLQLDAATQQNAALAEQLAASAAGLQDRARTLQVVSRTFELGSEPAEAMRREGAGEGGDAVPTGGVAQDGPAELPTEPTRP
jgi:methyl-accepting chemotaxis protein